MLHLQGGSAHTCIVLNTHCKLIKMGFESISINNHKHIIFFHKNFFFFNSYSPHSQKIIAAVFQIWSYLKSIRIVNEYVFLKKVFIINMK